MAKYIPKHAAPGKHGAARAARRARRQDGRAAAVPREQSRPVPARRRAEKDGHGGRPRAVLLAALAVVFVLAAGMLVRSLRRDELKGTWALDETTVYEFDGRGSGTLRLPLESYAFSYTVEGNELLIDFADETATDAGYSYTRRGAELTLDTDTGTVYRLREQE